MLKYIRFEKANKVAFYERRKEAKEREFLSFLTDFEGINSTSFSTDFNIHKDENSVHSTILHHLIDFIILFNY